MFKNRQRFEYHVKCPKCDWEGLVGKFEVVAYQGKRITIRRCPACNFRAITKEFESISYMEVF